MSECHEETHKNDALFFSSIGPDTLLPAQPCLFDHFAYLDSVFRLCLRKGFW